MNRDNGVSNDKFVLSDGTVHADSKANNGSRVDSNRMWYMYQGLASCNLSQDGLVQGNNRRSPLS